MLDNLFLYDSFHANLVLDINKLEPSMHKSYQPTLPAANRLLQKKWDDKYYSEHRLLVILFDNLRLSQI